MRRKIRSERIQLKGYRRIQPNKHDDYYYEYYRYKDYYYNMNSVWIINLFSLW